MRYVSNRLNPAGRTRFGLWIILSLLLAGGSILRLNSAAAESEQEPNETAQQATPIAIPGQRTGTTRYGDAAVIEFTYVNGPKDKIEDLFKFSIPDGQTRRLDIMLTFDNPAADLDLILFQQVDNALSAIKVSNGSSTTERITPIITLGPGNYFIGVSAFDDPGNTASANYTLSITSDTAPPPPVINSISPVSAIAGGGAFSLTVNGSYFIDGQSVVRWNGVNKTTTFINDTTLVAFLSSADIATSGTVLVTVSNPQSLGGLSNAVNFLVFPPGSAELEVEPNDAPQQANLLLVPGKRGGSVNVGDAAQTIIQLNNGLTDPVEDLFAVNLAQTSRLDIQLNGTNSNSNLALYLMKEVTNSSQLSMIGNSRFSGPIQRITTAAMLAPGRYLVGVSAVTGSSNYTVEAGIPGNRLLQVMANSAAPNSTVTVPISFFSEGNENILNFSLSFDPAVLSNPQVTLGNDATTATLNLNSSQFAQGRIGVQLTLPQGQKFTAGSREILKLNFAINAAAGVNSTFVDFTDQPVVRGMVDVDGNAVIGTYQGGNVIVIPGFEADVNPRPTGNGDGSVTIADWTQAGRFAAAIDTPADGSEFQRADCAPKSTLGDGRLTVADWVMAGRYAAGLETPVAAGGPSSPVSTLTDEEKVFASAESPEAGQQQGRAVRVKEDTFHRGQENELVLELVSQGNENAIGLSINFDSTQLSFVRASLGEDAAGAVLNVNTLRLPEGRVGFGLALPSGQTFSAGAQRILKVVFNLPQTSSVNATTISFGDLPVTREIVDSLANVLSATFQPGLIKLDPPVNPIPSLSSLEPGTVIVGGPSLALKVNGNNFVDGSVVLVDGAARATQFVSGTQLTANLTADDIAGVGTLSITVQNPAPAGGLSNALELSIVNPVPALTSLNPSAVAVGGSGFILTVKGNNFVPGAVVQFNGGNRATSFVNSTELSAEILNTDIASAASASIRVINPIPGGGISNSLSLTISTPSPLPRITNINPTSVLAGSGEFTLTVNGLSFVSNSVVRFNGKPLPTIFVNNTQLTARVDPSLIANPGTATINVVSPAPGGGDSNAVLLAINVPPNPVPEVSGLAPNPVTAGGPAFTLTVTGKNFVSASVVRFNGADRLTTVVSANELRAQISAADIANGGSAAIRVFNPTPGGGVSNELTLTIKFGPPTITLLSPSSAIAGGQDFTLTVIGTNFVPGSFIRWNGENRQTTYLSVTELTVQIPAADIANVGTATVTVFAPEPGGGLSNPVSFAIRQAERPLPRITSISPDSVIAGGPSFSLVVNGLNFVSDSEVRLNGVARPTTFAGSTQLIAQITEADIANLGAARITVFTPPAGGGESNAVELSITQPPNPLPTITGIAPGTVAAGGAAFVLTVNGGGFTSSSVVRFNGSGRPTSFVSANQLTAKISAADIAVADTIGIRVFNPSPGGGTSNEALLTIVNPAPVIANLNPNPVEVGSPGLILTVNGSNFIAGADVRVNGSSRFTTFINATQLTAQIPASDLAAAGSLNLQVFNPQPGGGPSNVVVLEVRKPSPLARIFSITPEVVSAGGPGFALVINGSGYFNGSIVRINGQDRQTELVSETVLAVQISAAEIASAGVLSIQVFNPPPGGGRSNTVNLTIVNPKPRITGLIPNTASAGGPSFTLLVNGEGFVASSVLRFNGVSVPTTLVTSTQLSAVIPAEAIASGGAVPVDVVNPEPGGGASNISVFNITGPAAAITSLNPSQVFAGSTDFVVVVSGSGFVNGAVVRVNDQDRPTTFISDTRLAAVILSSDVQNAGTAGITVANPSGSPSNALQLSILNPSPVLSSLNPASVQAGSGGFTLTVSGLKFVPGAVVQWNGGARQTTFVSSTQLNAAIPATDLASPGTVMVNVINPDPSGGPSNALVFAVTQQNPVPVLVSLNPGEIIAGSAAFSLTINGLGFVPGSVVQLNGVNRPTAFVNSTQLTVGIAGADVAVPGAIAVSVVSPAPGGGKSNELILTIKAPPNPVPGLTAISPATAIEGDQETALTVTGTNFVPGAIVLWNSISLPTTYLSANQLSALIPQSLLANVVMVDITVFNPAPGGGLSNARPFTVTSFAGSCQKICLRSALYYSLNPGEFPFGSVLIGGVNSNNPIPIGPNNEDVQRALNGGESPLQKLNRQFVALQLSLLNAGTQANSPAVLNSQLRCYDVVFDPLQLSNGFKLSRYSLFGDLLNQTRMAITENRVEDFTRLATVLGLLNGDDQFGVCR